ncbi:MAG: DUF1778 domain-containing protein [Nitrospinae bacterium]|nr:DUF1778 domain-containing protein [Nitrospinota bacterium]
MPSAKNRKESNISFRISKNDKELIRRASEMTHTNMTEFIVSKSRDAAIEVLGQQTAIKLSKPDWERFCAALDNPPKTNPALRKLLKTPGVFNE